MVTFRKPPYEATQHPTDIEALLQKHKVVFEDLPAGWPPDMGFEHIIELEEGTQAVITTLLKNRIWYMQLNFYTLIHKQN